MAQVVLKLVELNPLEKVSTARGSVNKMAGNADYPDPDPTLADISARADALEQAIINVDDLREQLMAAINIRDTREMELDGDLTQLALYVQQKSGGIAEKILGAGMQVKSKGNASPLPVAVDNFLLREDVAGNRWVEADWKRLPKVYNVQTYQLRYKMGSVETGDWTLLDLVTKKSKLRFQAPQTGRIWGQVRAVNATGYGDWSDPATIVIKESL